MTVTVPSSAAASLEELREAVLNACLALAPEQVPLPWLDASQLQSSMVLSASADGGDIGAIRFEDLRALTPALAANVERSVAAALEAEAAAAAAEAEAEADADVPPLPIDVVAADEAGGLPVPPVRSVPFLLKLTVPMYGIGIAWGAQYAKVTPVLQELGLPPSLLSVAWLAGPISGLIVQPLIGQLSDRTTGQSRGYRCCCCFAGKRRLWMWVGNADGSRARARCAVDGRPGSGGARRPRGDSSRCDRATSIFDPAGLGGLPGGGRRPMGRKGWVGGSARRCARRLVWYVWARMQSVYGRTKQPTPGLGGCFPLPSQTCNLTGTLDGGGRVMAAPQASGSGT